MSALLASWLNPTSLVLLLNIMIGTIFLISRLSTPKTPNHRQFGNDGSDSAPPVLHRAPSLLDRVKSISFSTYKFPLPNQDFDHPLERAPSILERVKAIDFSFYKYSSQNPDTDYIQPTEQDNINPQPLGRAPSLLERVKSIKFTSFYRCDSVKSDQQMEPPPTEEAHSDMIQVHGQVKTSKSEYSKVKQGKSPEKMKISTSENSRCKAEEKEEDQEEEVQKRRTATMWMKKTVSSWDDDQGVDAKADDFIKKFKQQLKLQRLDSLLRYRDIVNGK